MQTIHGVVVPTLTLFTPDGQVDEELCRQHADWLLAKGVHGLFVTGTYGSGYLMPPHQRVQVFRLARKAAASYPDRFVIAHVGCADTAGSVYLAQQAAELGLDAVSAIAPYNYKYSEAELLDYFRAVMAAAGQLPFYAYNNPAITGSALPWTLLEALAGLGAAGVKDSSVSINLACKVQVACRQQGWDLAYVAGTTNGWPALRGCGARAMISGLANFAPELALGLWQAGEDRDDDRLWQAYALCEEISSLVKKCGNNSQDATQLALSLRGLATGSMRAPLRLDAEGRRQQLDRLKKGLELALSQP